MRNRSHRDFDSQSEEFLEDLPDYYRRNFHFQTNGYLSRNSALLYDHQVDVIFSGAAGAMRRMVIPPLRAHLKTLERPQLLELGCGPASSTVYLAKAFPKAKITAVDLSSPYVKVAQVRLKDYPRADAIQADAAHLPFKESSSTPSLRFLCFTRCRKITRLEVLREAHRVLKPGGIFVLADSIQWNDNPEFNWALERFPLNYHEPFYHNYIHTPLKDLFQAAGFEKVEQNQRFLTKVAYSSRTSSLSRSRTRDI